jgi:hypothetical protein
VVIPAHLDTLAFYGFQNVKVKIAGRADLADPARCGPRSGHMGDIRNLRELAPLLPYSEQCHLFRGDATPYDT